MFGRKEIEEKIKNLEDRLFEKPKSYENMFYFERLANTFWSYTNQPPATLESRIEKLESKINLLMNHLGLEVKHEVKEEKDVVVPSKRRGRQPKKGR